MVIFFSKLPCDKGNESSHLKKFLKKDVGQVIQSDLFGMVKWPVQGLSDLQLGDKKVTLNHLVGGFFLFGKMRVSFLPVT